MQMMGPETMGYDRVATVFSPDGRLFQVQYAMEAVKRGATVIGIVAKNVVVMAADKRVTNQLMVPSSIEKIYKVDEHIGIATSGLVADGRKIVDEARVESQRNKIVYGEPIDVTSVVRYVCDMSQIFTQYGGLRPFGVSLLIGGVNGNKPRLFETDPSGTPTEWKAAALGEGRGEIMETLEKEYKDDMPTDDAISLTLRALSKAMKKKIEPDRIEVVVISKEGFDRLTENKIKAIVDKTAPAGGKGK
jgi:proteasome alpha subunit